MSTVICTRTSFVFIPVSFSLTLLRTARAFWLINSGRPSTRASTTTYYEYNMYCKISTE